MTVLTILKTVDSEVAHSARALYSRLSPNLQEIILTANKKVHRADKPEVTRKIKAAALRVLAKETNDIRVIAALVKKTVKETEEALRVFKINFTSKSKNTFALKEF